MTTATKSRPKVRETDPLATVEAAEQAWVQARDEATKMSHEHADLLRRHQELTDQRRRTVHRNPELVDHKLVPVDDENEVAQIDNALAELPDLGESAIRVEHAKRIEHSKRQAFEDQVRNHAETMRQAERAKDEGLRAAFAEEMSKAADLAKQRIGVRHRLMEIAHICHEDTRGIAIDAVASESRTTRAMAESPAASA